VIRTRLIDRPGQLMELLKLIADAHVNILVVSHHRESVEVAVALDVLRWRGNRG